MGIGTVPRGFIIKYFNSCLTPFEKKKNRNLQYANLISIIPSSIPEYCCVTKFAKYVKRSLQNMPSHSSFPDGKGPFLDLGTKKVQFGGRWLRRMKVAADFEELSPLLLAEKDPAKEAAQEAVKEAVQDPPIDLSIDPEHLILKASFYHSLAEQLDADGYLYLKKVLPPDKVQIAKRKVMEHMALRLLPDIDEVNSHFFFSFQNAAANSTFLNFCFTFFFEFRQTGS